MHRYIDWDDDKEPLVNSSPKEAEPVTTALLEPPPKQPMGEQITFRDIYDGVERTGTIIRSITSGKHENELLGSLPIVTLRLVAYKSATRENDYTVIWDALIIRPKKPRP